MGVEASGAEGFLCTPLAQMSLLSAGLSFEAGENAAENKFPRASQQAAPLSR